MYTVQLRLEYGAGSRKGVLSSLVGLFTEGGDWNRP